MRNRVQSKYKLYETYIPYICMPQWFSAVDNFVSQGDVWRCLETVLIVTTKAGQEMLPTLSR